MELLQLKYFKATAEFGKISEAAQALFLSAPALSLSISKLEKELGFSLFDRTGNKILLNRQGEIFLRYVNQIFATLDCAKTELQQSLLPQNPHVSIASITTIWWIDMITTFSEEHPHFTLSCTGFKRHELEERGLSLQHSFLLASEEDVPAHMAEEMDSLLLFEDHPLLMVHPNHPLASRSSVSLQELSGETIFLPLKEYPLHTHLMQLFEQCSLPFPAGNAYSSLVSSSLVDKGLGIAFTTRAAARTPLHSLRYLSISNSYRPWSCRLYWRKNVRLSQDELLFKSFVETYYSRR